MPYPQLKDLPNQIKENLPNHAQHIYQDAFNSAWEQYHQDETRAHKVAWAAVKQKYQKDKGGQWIKKKEDT